MIVEEYLRLGLAAGRHIDGMVDAYYGPSRLADEAASGAPVAPAALAERARRLLGDIDADPDLEPVRRRWLSAQVHGLHTTLRRLSGELIAYLDEVELCYGVRPNFVDEDAFAVAHRQLEDLLPGQGRLAERYITWRESNVVAAERLEEAVASVSEDFRHRTATMFGLPEGEEVDFELVTAKPWSGFNYYLGDMRSRVAINVDLPVLSLAFGQLIAHEAYPGHHTEHCRKEAGLVRQRRQLEESIFLVGTPQCLIAEGLADLAFEVIAAPTPETVVAEHLKPLGVRYDAAVAASAAEAMEVLGSARANAAIGIHDRGWTQDDAVGYLERWALLSQPRAVKLLQFLTDPTWRAYTFCYSEGLPLCRQYVRGDVERFRTLITDQVTPSQLAA